jgi:hypothetical protein
MGPYAYGLIGVGTVFVGLAVIQIKMSLEERRWRKQATRKKDKIKL